MDWHKLSSIVLSKKQPFSFEVSEIAVIYAHHSYPIIFAGKKSSVLILWDKTMTSIGELSGGTHTYHHIKLNNNGDKIIGIDSVGDISIWRFNLLFSTRNTPMLWIRGQDVKDCCFVNNSSFLVTISHKGIAKYDLTKPEKSMKDWDYSDVTGDKIIYSPHGKCCIVVNFKKNEIYTFDI